MVVVGIVGAAVVALLGGAVVLITSWYFTLLDCSGKPKANKGTKNYIFSQTYLIKSFLSMKILFSPYHCHFMIIFMIY